VTPAAGRTVEGEVVGSGARIGQSGAGHGGSGGGQETTSCVGAAEAPMSEPAAAATSTSTSTATSTSASASACAASTAAVEPRRRLSQARAPATRHSTAFYYYNLA
jgi:hypothetical protein